MFPSREEYERQQREAIDKLSIPDVLLGMLMNWPAGKGGQDLPPINRNKIHQCMDWVKAKKLEEESKCQR